MSNDPNSKGSSELVLFETDDWGLVPVIDDYWNSGYGRIIMVPRVKLAYDKVSLNCARRHSSPLESLAHAHDFGLDSHLAAGLRHHPPRPPKPDRHPGLQTPRRSA